MAGNYPALKTEITTDPAALGYSGKTDAEVATLLNAAVVTTTTPRGVIPAHEVWEAMVPGEWTALSAAEKQRVQTLLSMGEVNLEGTNTRASLAAAFGAGTATRTALLALQNLTTSTPRSAVIFGALVSGADIAFARSL